MKSKLSVFIMKSFIMCVALLLSAPFIFAHRYVDLDDTSEDENRTLAHATAIFKDGRLYQDFPKEYDRWFSDHLGFRKTMINRNAWLEYYLFHRFPDGTNFKLGKTDEIVDGNELMVQSFAHLNLLSEEQIEEIGNSCQIISDWLADKGIQFYMVQCVEKHEIFPDSYIDGVSQIGTESMEDQIMSYLDHHTTVKHLYLKNSMEHNKDQYSIYNHWGDPAHWTPRGAYIGYQEVMSLINHNGNRYRVLSESDYDITLEDFGETYYGRIYKEDIREEFTIRNPQAKQKAYIADIEGMIDDPRHVVWENPSVDNASRLLILGDSYFYMFIADDFAESFSTTWMMMGDYLMELPQIIDCYQPDIIIMENAQRANRYPLINQFATEIVKIQESRE